MKHYFIQKLHFNPIKLPHIVSFGFSFILTNIFYLFTKPKIKTTFQTLQTYEKDAKKLPTTCSCAYTCFN